MDKKPLYELIIGGDYLAQPKHKPKAIPKDFLAHFYNVNPRNLEEIVNFANNYSFSEYVAPDGENLIEDKFLKIHRKYARIIEKILEADAINYSDLKTINDDLQTTSPQICLKEKINDLKKIANNFDVYTLKNVKGEQPDITVTPIGAFEVDKKASHVRVVVNMPKTSKTLWYLDRIKDGTTKIWEIFPSNSVWGLQRKYLNSIILKDGILRFNNNGQPISIEMNFWMGKTDFVKEELQAFWSTASALGESVIAKRIWDYLSDEQKKPKRCKICSDFITGNSPNFCEKEDCKKEYDSVRHKK